MIWIIPKKTLTFHGLHPRTTGVTLTQLFYLSARLLFRDLLHSQISPGGPERSTQYEDSSWGRFDFFSSVLQVEL